MRNHNIAQDKPRNHSWDIAIVTTIAIIAFILSAYYDALEYLVEFTRKHEHWQLDEFITVSLVLVFVLACYSVYRWRQLNAMNHLISKKNDDLQQAFGEIKQLKGILPICASCKKIRDDNGYWHQVESYVRDHTEAEFSHGLCPECAKKLYPQIVLDEYSDIPPSC